MTARIEVVHIPARTPYARKLTGPDIQIVNGSVPSRGHGGIVPRDLTLQGLLDRRPFSWFDVLHLHHIEFDTHAVLDQALEECRRAGRKVVFTAHDVDPVFTPEASYRRKLATLADGQVPFVCLTRGSAATISQRFGLPAVAAVIPHGYVVAPGTIPRRPAGRNGRAPAYLMFGSLRASRDIETVLYNWRFGRAQQATTMRMVLRAPARIQLDRESAAWNMIASFAAAEPRLRVEVTPFPTDQDIAQACSQSDALILPYRWASHSGQLELAFDLGMLAVASDAGYLREQHEQHAGLVPEPAWFNWGDGAEYEYGERFLAALDQAAALIPAPPDSNREREFAEHRAREHARIMLAYHEIYSRQWT